MVDNQNMFNRYPMSHAMSKNKPNPLKKILIIKDSLPNEDPRVIKEANILRNSGYDVTLMGWCIEREFREKKYDSNYRRIIFDFNRPTGLLVILYLPLWWCYVFLKLILEDWAIAHVINIQSIIPVLIAGKLKNKPIIYEIEDVYEDGGLNIPLFLRNILKYIDKIFMKISTAVILIDEKQSEEFSGIPNRNKYIIYDSPRDTYKEIDRFGESNDIFTIFNDAMLFKRRQLMLDKLFAAINNIPGVKLVISGSGDQADEIKLWCDQNLQKFEFLGYISYEEVIQRSLHANLLLGIRNPKNLSFRYNCGSKLLKAMMCGKPCLVNIGTSAANIVAKENCGLVVNANNSDEIKNAIIKLKEDPELCKKLGANGRNAYEQRYSWQIMEQRLLALYQELVGLGKRKKKHNEE